MIPRHHVRFLWPTLLVVALALSTTASARSPVSSPNDPRQYEAFVLANGMRVLLVSDPDTERAAAALEVMVGSAHDPVGRDGMAHFLEHALFLGTDGFPDPAEDQAFFAAHGGRRNAYTAFENTGYFFDIDADHLEPALERFSRLFVAPLFLPDAVARERNVVHSEFESRRSQERWRLNSALRQVINPDHPYSRFNVGSVDTLADHGGSSIRDEIITFYRRHYSADLMSLVVLGAEPLAVLREWVEARYSGVPNHDAARRSLDMPLFVPGDLPMRLDIVPSTEHRTVSLRFAVPAVRVHYSRAPLRYIAHLLSDRGPGSVVAALRERGWAEWMSAGTGPDHVDSTMFKISVRLSPLGLEHLDDVVGMVFAAIDRIRDSGVEKWRFEELQRKAELDFRFNRYTAPIHLVRSLARNMHRYPMRDVLRGPYALDDYDPELIVAYLERLRPDNVLMTVVAPGLETDRHEPRFQVDYRKAPIDHDRRAAWSESASRAALDTALPPPNRFLPVDTSVPSDRAQATVPVRLVREPGLDVWFHRDTELDAPRTELYLGVRPAAPMDHPRHAALAALYVTMVNDELYEAVHAARRAGGGYSLHTRTDGLMLRVSGYRDGYGRLVERVASAMRFPSLDAARFELSRQSLRRQWANVSRDVPHRQTTGELSRLLLAQRWTADERLAELETITLEELREFVDVFWTAVSAVALIHANMTADDADALAALLRDGVLAGAGAADIGAPAAVVDVADGRRRVRELEIDHDDSALTVYVQGPDRSYDTRARLRMIARILAPRFFHDLRTKQHIGYVVRVVYLPLLDSPGIAFIVQSPTVDPVEIEARIVDFLRRTDSVLREMSQEEFDRQRDAIVGMLTGEGRRPEMRADRFWLDLDRGNLAFDSRDREMAALNALENEDVAGAYRKWLIDRGGDWLVVRSIGGGLAPAQVEELARDDGDRIVDPVAFRSGRGHVPGRRVAAGTW